jgi:hypothetical protein
MRTLVDRCPACGGETDPDAALKAGGLLVWSEGKDFYLAIPRIPNSLRSIQPADVPDVIDLMEHWKYHKQNRHLFK